MKQGSLVNRVNGSNISMESLPSGNAVLIDRPHASAPGDYFRMKKLNRGIAALKVLLHNYSIETMPQWMNLHATAVCNLSCPHCETHGTEERRKIFNNKKLDMPYDTFVRVAKESLPWAREYSLSLAGEPLATPNLENVLHELGPFGAKLHLVTNGTYFSKEMLIKILPVTSRIEISIDGATKLTCEAIRLGVRFERLLKNIRLLTRTLELLPAMVRPPVCLAYTIMGSNIRDLPLMVRLASFLGISTVNGSFVIIVPGDFQHIWNEPVELHKSLYNAYQEKAHAVAKQFGVLLNTPSPFPGVEADAHAPVGGDGMIIGQLPANYYETLPSFESLVDPAAIEREAIEIASVINPHSSVPLEPGSTAPQTSNGGFWRRLFRAGNGLVKLNLKETLRRWDRKVVYCEYLHNRMYINYAGDVSPCCIVGAPVLGNIHEESVKEIWNGVLYNAFRKKFYSADPVDCCKGCINVTYKPRLAFVREALQNSPVSTSLHVASRWLKHFGKDKDAFEGLTDEQIGHMFDRSGN